MPLLEKSRFLSRLKSTGQGSEMSILIARRPESSSARFISIVELESSTSGYEADIKETLRKQI